MESICQNGVLISGSSNLSVMKQLDNDLKKVYRTFFFKCKFDPIRLARERHKLYTSTELHFLKLLNHYAKKFKKVPVRFLAQRKN